MNKEQIIQCESQGELTSRAALDLSIEIRSLLESQEQVNFVLTGGTVGILVLGELSKHLVDLDLTKLHIWWGDERFVASNSPDRNDVQADQALLDFIQLPKSNIHRFPSQEAGSLHEAATLFQIEIEALEPSFDIVLLGMGPDGHIASLFPGSSPKEFGLFVVAEENSPKPPPQRLSLSYSALNSSDQVWFLVSGEEKSEAIKLIFEGSELPAGRVRGKNATRWYLDRSASALISS